VFDRSAVSWRYKPIFWSATGWQQNPLTEADAGTGFASRIITSLDGDIAEDKVVTMAGSNNATPTLKSSGPWAMQMVDI
jgi:hypothetical protein